MAPVNNEIKIKWSVDGSKRIFNTEEEANLFCIRRDKRHIANGKILSTIRDCEADQDYKVHIERAIRFSIESLFFEEGS